MFVQSHLTSFGLLYSSLVVFTAITASLQLINAKSIRFVGFSHLKNSEASKMRRGGCAAFGHSCFGGHGKRTDTIVNSNDAYESQITMHPRVENFKSVINEEEFRAPVEIQAHNNEINGAEPQYYDMGTYIRLAPVFRKWLANNYKPEDFLIVRK